MCIKMDLALNHLQWLICHKTNQPTKQTNKQTYLIYLSIYLSIYLYQSAHTYVPMYLYMYISLNTYQESVKEFASVVIEFEIKHMEYNELKRAAIYIKNVESLLIKDIKVTPDTWWVYTYQSATSEVTNGVPLTGRPNVSAKRSAILRVPRVRNRVDWFTSGLRQWSGRSGFNPRSCHTEDFKNGT